MLLEDRDQNIWNLWWVRYSLFHFKNPFHTDFIYYPNGVSLYFHTLNFMNGLLSLPIQLGFGTTAAYNFVVFFSFVLGGIGAYLLLRYLCANGSAAFVGSIVFAYSPYHLGTLKGLLQLISLEWLPFYILFLLLATREKSHKARHIVLAAFFLFCTGLTDWYYTLFLLMFTFLYLFYLVGSLLLNGFTKRRNPLPEIKNTVLILAAVGGLFLLAISPVLLPMFTELGSSDYYLPSSNAATDFSANLAAFFVPPTTATLLGGFAKAFPAQYLTGSLAAQVYLGYCALGLGILGLLFRRQARFWGVTFLVFWLLSLGPRLQINGDSPGWPMPFALIQNLPVIKVSRSPDRFMVIAMLALAVCVAFGLDWLQKARFAQPKRSGLSERFNGLALRYGGSLTLVAGLLIGLEFLQIPYSVNKVETSAFWQQLGQDASDYSLIELPPQGGFWSGGPRMAAQAIHHKRIFDGYISREFDHPFYRDTPGFEQLAALNNVPEIFMAGSTPGLPGQQDWYAAFGYYKVRYLIIDYPQSPKQRATFDLAKNRAAIYRVLGQNVRPVYQDDFLEAYQLPALTAPQPFLQIGDGWYAAEADNVGGGVHRWAKSTANLNTLWAGPGSRGATLKLKIGLLTTSKHLSILYNGQEVYSGVLNGPPQTLQVPLNLAVGSGTLQFLVDGTAQTPQSLGMGDDKRPLLYFIDAVELS